MHSDFIPFHLSGCNVFSPPVSLNNCLQNSHQRTELNLSKPPNPANMPVIDGLPNSTGEAHAAKGGNEASKTIKKKPFKTSITEQPVTEERKPYIATSDSVLTNSGTTRATLAASHDNPTAPRSMIGQPSTNAKQ